MGHPERDTCASHGNLVICRGPAMREAKRQSWQTRWCFNCRKRLPHDAVLFVAVDPTEDWYGPHWAVECSGCGGDYVRFPGTADGPVLETVYA